MAETWEPVSSLSSTVYTRPRALERERKVCIMSKYKEDACQSNTRTIRIRTVVGKALLAQLIPDDNPGSAGHGSDHHKSRTPCATQFDNYMYE